MSVSTFTQPDVTSQAPSAYKTAIDGSVSVLKRYGDWFAPHAQGTPNMTVALDAGFIWNAGSLTAVATQNTGTITAPVSNPRIDRVVVDSSTGAVSVITGTENASPTAPAITSGKYPVAQVLLQTSTTSIANSMITDERVFPTPVAGTFSPLTAGGAVDKTKKVLFDTDSLTTATTRTYTAQDKSGVMALISDVGLAQDFRLTLTTAVPVTIADVTGATTIYCTPYKGNRIALYDGSKWNIRTSAEFSLALGTITSGKPYDVFVYDNAGVPTLEILVWTNDTTRATALAYQDGILVKSGDATRRYLGSFYSTSTTATEDSASNRYLWNYYHRVLRPMYNRPGGADHNYTTATWRQWAADSTAKIGFIVGVAEDEIRVETDVFSRNSSSNVPMYSGVGYDSTTSPAASASTDIASLNATVSYVANFNINVGIKRKLIPTAGRHYLALLEFSNATGTTTWVSGSSIMATGMA